MTNDEFLEELRRLEALGPAGIAEMREVMKACGGMKRLLAIAARGLGGRPKGSVRISVGGKTRISENFPDETAKQAAIVYWGKKRRPDLIATVEDIAERFHDHFLASGEKVENWSARWRNWYSTALEFNKPPREGGLFPVAETLFEQTNLVGWVGRLRVYYDSESRVWPHRWGGKPPENPSDAIPSGCRCPAQAFALYMTEKKRRGGGDAAHA